MTETGNQGYKDTMILNDMEEIIDWIIQNKEWVFSGIGVFVLGLFLSKKNVRNSLKAMFNIKSNITQINIENKDNEEE